MRDGGLIIYLCREMHLTLVKNNPKIYGYEMELLT